RRPRSKPPLAESRDAGGKRLPGYPVLVLQSERLLETEPGLLSEERGKYLSSCPWIETLLCNILLRHRASPDCSRCPRDIVPLARRRSDGARIPSGEFLCRGRNKT